MKQIYKSLSVIFLGASILFFAACAQSLAVSRSNVFESKSGVIGVFRQPVGFCSGGYQQQFDMGGEKIIAKPTWTSAQDNMFSAYIKPGMADLTEYRYGCGMIMTEVILKEKHGVVVPDKGFCKIVVSFLRKEKLLDRNDSLLRSFFVAEDVAVSYDDIPYCETY